MLNFTHIAYERLVDWADGRLPGDQQAGVEAHLASCTACREEAVRIQRLLGVMAADTSQDAPPALIARAVRLFQPRAVEPGPSLLQRLVAVLRFESTPLTPALGLRSQGSAERQLVYAAGDYDVDLRITPTVAGWTVSGQVLGSDTAGEAALAGGDTLMRATFGAHAHFTLAAAPAGVYTLVLALAGVEVVVEDLRLGGA